MKVNRERTALNRIVAGDLFNQKNSPDMETEVSPDNKTKPWLDSNMNVLPDAQLLELSRAWDVDTWERFLVATVDRNISRGETTLAKYEVLLEQEFEIARIRTFVLPLFVEKRIHQAIKTLTSFQRIVIEGFYFKKNSVREIAKTLNVAPSTVHESKKTSLNKIKHFLELDPNTVTYLIRGSQQFALEKGTRHEQIREVYNLDLRGGYLK